MSDVARNFNDSGNNLPQPFDGGGGFKLPKNSAPFYVSCAGIALAGITYSALAQSPVPPAGSETARHS